MSFQNIESKVKRDKEKQTCRDMKIGEIMEVTKEIC